MTVLVTIDALEELRAAHAVAPMGHEIGGILETRRRPGLADRAYSFTEIPNAATSAGIYMPEWADTWLGQVDGIRIHSHPGSEGRLDPSPMDIEAALGDGYKEVAIYAPAAHTVAVWNVLNAETIMPVETLIEGRERWSPRLRRSRRRGPYAAAMLRAGMLGPG